MTNNNFMSPSNCAGNKKIIGHNDKSGGNSKARMKFLLVE